jgi:hypothetical protein
VKLFFAPFSIAAGLVAGIVGRKAFEQVWGLIDKEEPPSPKHRDVSIVKMALALALEGAIFRIVRGLADHWIRGTFARFVGRWPGEERPEPEAG